MHATSILPQRDIRTTAPTHAIDYLLFFSPKHAHAISLLLATNYSSKGELSPLSVTCVQNGLGEAEYEISWRRRFT
jgi:hypothetical protein